MERRKDVYNAGGFSFETEEEAKRAERELHGVQFIRQKADLENPQTVFQLYRDLVDQDLFETPIGYCFLKELRDYLLLIPAIRNEDVPEIPIRYPQRGDAKRRAKQENTRKSKDTKEKPDGKQANARNEKNVDYKKRCHFFMVVSLVLALSVGTMMLLAATSDHVNILNYENKILDKYSAWEQELEERERQLDELEQ